MKTLAQIAKAHGVELARAKELMENQNMSIAPDKELTPEQESFVERIISTEASFTANPDQVINPELKPAKEPFDYSVKSDPVDTVKILLLIIVLVLVGCLVLFFSLDNLGGKKTVDNSTNSNAFQTSAPANESASSDNGINPVVYTWSDGICKWNYTSRIPTALYESVQKRDHTAIRSNYKSILNDDDCSYYFEHIVTSFKGQNNEIINYSEVNMMYMMIAFVQTFENTGDGMGYDDTTKYPLETLYEAKGDCEDKALLIAAILDKYDQDFVLLQYDGHIALAVDLTGSEDKPADAEYINVDGTDYCYIEPTSTDYAMGVIPDEYKDATPEVIIMN